MRYSWVILELYLKMHYTLRLHNRCYNSYCLQCPDWEAFLTSGDQSVEFRYRAPGLWIRGSARSLSCYMHDLWPPREEVRYPCWVLCIPFTRIEVFSFSPPSISDWSPGEEMAVSRFGTSTTANVWRYLKGVKSVHYLNTQNKHAFLWSDSEF